LVGAAFGVAAVCGGADRRFLATEFRGGESIVQRNGLRNLKRN